MTLLGKTVLITGGGSGAGENLALGFAAAGAQVVITGRRLEALQRVARLAPGIRALQGSPPALNDWDRDALNRARGVGDFETLLQACIELGARLIVCEMGLRSLDIDRASLRADVPFTVAGIVTLLEETKPGMHLLTL